MSFGQNLQCLRKMRNKMTQEELVRGDLNISDDAYSDIRRKTVSHSIM